MKILNLIVAVAILATPTLQAEFTWTDTEGKHLELSYKSRPIARYVYEAIDTSTPERREETYKEEVYDQVPVYATKYRYKIMEWVPKEKFLLKTGAKNHRPKWPEPPKQPDPQNWKEGSKTAAYYVFVKESDGDIHKEVVGFEFWSKLSIGQPLDAHRSYLFDMYYGIIAPAKDI